MPRGKPGTGPYAGKTKTAAKPKTTRKISKAAAPKTIKKTTKRSAKSKKG